MLGSFFYAKNSDVHLWTMYVLIRTIRFQDKDNQSTLTIWLKASFLLLFLLEQNMPMYWFKKQVWGLSMILSEIFQTIHFTLWSTLLALRLVLHALHLYWSIFWMRCRLINIIMIIQIFIGLSPILIFRGRNNMFPKLHLPWDQPC